MHCELVLRGDALAPDGNHLLDLLFGARVDVVPAERYRTQLPDLLEATAERCRRRGLSPLVIPTGGSDGLGLWGYVVAAAELAGDFKAAGIAPAVVTATGSGGTQAGLTAGFARLDTGTPVLGVAVCDDADTFNAKVHTDIAACRTRFPQLGEFVVNPQTVDGYIGAGYGIASEPVYDLIAELAALEGIVLDPVYTGKAFFGLTAEIAAGRWPAGSDIVFVHTGGIFGVFSHRAALADAATRIASHHD